MSNWIVPEPWMLDTVAEALNLGRDAVDRLASTGGLRFRVFRGVYYAVLELDLKEYPSGTIVMFDRGWSRVIPAYPGIREVVLPSLTLPRHFIDKIVIEERIVGYNVRVVLVKGDLYAVTRNGLICPYTTDRIVRSLGKKLAKMLNELGPEDYIVVGEVAGLENPYKRYYYPESPRFSYYVFDIMYKGRLIPLAKRDQILGTYGVPFIPVHSIIDKNDVEAFKRIVGALSRQGRGGAVLKDPYHRVPPLKYTASYRSMEEIRTSMKYFMDGVEALVFYSIVREAFRAYEEEAGPNRLEQLATELGLTILGSIMEAIHSVEGGSGVYEEYELEFESEDKLREFIEFMSDMNIELHTLKTVKRGDMIVARLGEVKKTPAYIREVLETGVLPLSQPRLSKPGETLTHLVNP